MDGPVPACQAVDDQPPATETRLFTGLSVSLQPPATVGFVTVSGTVGWVDELAFAPAGIEVEMSNRMAVVGRRIPIKKLNARLYEYACHKGNYGLAGVLSGARYEERMEAQGSSDSRRD